MRRRRTEKIRGDLRRSKEIRGDLRRGRTEEIRGDLRRSEEERYLAGTSPPPLRTSADSGRSEHSWGGSASLRPAGGDRVTGASAEDSQDQRLQVQDLASEPGLHPYPGEVTRTCPPLVEDLNTRPHQDTWTRPSPSGGQVFSRSGGVKHLTDQAPVDPSIRSSIHLSLRSSIHLSNQLSIYSSVHLFIHPSIPPSIHLSNQPSIHSFNHLFICPSIQSSIQPSICLSIQPSIHLSNHLSLHPSTHQVVELVSLGWDEC